MLKICIFSNFCSFISLGFLPYIDFDPVLGMCFLAFCKLVCALIYGIILFGLILELALPHWRLYVNENGEAQLQTGILGQCNPKGRQTLLKFNDSVALIGTEVCQKWNMERPISDFVVLYCLICTIIILIFNLIWTILSFYQCCCDNCCFYVLPSTSTVATIFLISAVTIFHQSYQNDGDNTGIPTKYIHKHGSFYTVASMIYPMIGTIFGAMFAVFLEDSFCHVEKQE